MGLLKRWPLKKNKATKRTASAFVWNVESFVDGRLSGWAADLADLSRPVAIDLHVNGVLVQHHFAAVFRSDVEDAGYPGAHGFCFDVDCAAFPIVTDVQLFLRSEINSGSVELPISPEIYTSLSGTLERESFRAERMVKIKRNEIEIIVKCFLMQKNEAKLLEPWIKYYSYLFGIRNLVVYDNGSSDPKCLDVLARYEGRGLKVIRCFSSVQDFIDKGEIIGQAIKQLDKDGEPYDVALALDCDEFIVAIDRKVSFERSTILTELRRLCGARRPVVLTELFTNVPECGGWFTCEHTPKAIILANTLAHLDHGFHHPQTRHGGALRKTTRLGHIHLHNRELSEMRSFARQKLAPFLNTCDANALRNWTGSGHHLIDYFLLDESEWAERFSKRATLSLPQIFECFNALGISTLDTLHSEVDPATSPNSTFRTPEGDIIDFDPVTYYATREDVRSVGLGPFYHFAKYGLKEQRQSAEEALQQCEPAKSRPFEQ